MRLKTKEIITKYLRVSPLSLVIREACRMIAIQEVLERYEDKPIKILDVGCGDGSWWEILSQERAFSVDGIDINTKEIAKAVGKINARVIDITRDEDLVSLHIDYDLVIGNCSLEHIPDINKALINIQRHMRVGAEFVLFVPTPYWALKGHSVKVLNQVSPRLSMMISGMINGFFQHWHLYHHDLWAHILKSNGFSIKEVRGIGSSRLEFLYRLFLPTAFVSFLVKSVTGKYLNEYISRFMPSSHYSNVAEGLSPLVDVSLTNAEDADAFEYMIIAKKVATHVP